MINCVGCGTVLDSINVSFCKECGKENPCAVFFFNEKSYSQWSKVIPATYQASHAQVKPQENASYRPVSQSDVYANMVSMTTMLPPIGKMNISWRCSKCGNSNMQTTNVIKDGLIASSHTNKPSYEKARLKYNVQLSKIKEVTSNKEFNFLKLTNRCHICKKKEAWTRIMPFWKIFVSCLPLSFVATVNAELERGLSAEELGWMFYSCVAFMPLIIWTVLIVIQMVKIRKTPQASLPTFVLRDHVDSDNSITISASR